MIDDTLDEFLAERFDALTAIEPPDVWSRLEVDTAAPSSRIGPGLFRIAAAVAAAAVVLVGVWAWSARGTEDLTFAGDPPLSDGSSSAISNVAVDDEQRVADVRLPDGSRIAFYYPAAWGDSLRLAEVSGKDDEFEIYATGARMKLKLHSRDDFPSRCLVNSVSRISGSGLLVTELSDRSRVNLCATHIGIQGEIETDQPLDEGQVDQFHLITLEYGSTYRDVRTRFGRCCDGFFTVTMGERIAASVGGQVWALDAATLVRQWAIGDLEERSTSLVNDQPTDSPVVLVSSQGDIVGVDMATGEELWHFDDGVRWEHTGVAQRGDIRYVLTGSCCDIRASPPMVVAVDVFSGDVLWVAEGFRATGWDGGAPVLLGDLLIMSDSPQANDGADESHVMAFDINTGARVWATQISGPRDGWGYDRLAVNPDVDPNLLLVPTFDGELLRINTRDGSIVWRSNSGHGVVTEINSETFTFERFEGFDFFAGDAVEVSLATGEPA